MGRCQKLDTKAGTASAMIVSSCSPDDGRNRLISLLDPQPEGCALDVLHGERRGGGAIAAEGEDERDWRCRLRRRRQGGQTFGGAMARPPAKDHAADRPPG